MSDQENFTFSAQPPAVAPLPETIEINGVTYRRESNDVDKQVNRIKDYIAIANRAGVSLQQAYFFRTGLVIPD